VAFKFKVTRLADGTTKEIVRESDPADDRDRLFTEVYRTLRMFSAFVSSYTAHDYARRIVEIEPGTESGTILPGWIFRIDQV
jgi:hypothetical protein